MYTSTLTEKAKEAVTAFTHHLVALCIIPTCMPMHYPYMHVALSLVVDKWRKKKAFKKKNLLLVGHVALSIVVDKWRNVRRRHAPALIDDLIN